MIQTLNTLKSAAKQTFERLTPVKQAIRDAITNPYANMCRSVKVMTEHTEKFGTTCCALAIYSMYDNTSIEEIQYIIERQKREAILHWTTASRASGEMNIVVITTPTELNLEQNLEKCGFVCIKNDMKRRNGYPGGKLKMWMLILPD